MSQDSKSLEWKAQCFLLSNAKQINAQAGRELGGRRLPQGPPHVVVQKVEGNPNGLINSFMRKKTLDILKLPDIYKNLALQPYIQIYKTIVDSDDNERDYPILASDYYNHTLNAINDPTNLLNPSLRDSGVKIKDLELVRLGGNPAEIDTNIEVTLTLHADKLGSYIQKQYPIDADGERETEGISWIDLLTLNRIGNNRDPHVYVDTRAQIKLEVGYIDPAQIPGLREEIKSSEFDKWSDVIAEQREVFNLKFVEHEFDFQDDGAVGLRLVFIASAHVAQQVGKADLLHSPALEAKMEGFSGSIRDIRAAAAAIEEVTVPEPLGDEPYPRDNLQTGVTNPEWLHWQAREFEISAARAHNESIETCKRMLQQEIEGIEIAIRKSRAESAKRLLNQLWLGFGVRGSQPRFKPRIYGIKVNQQLFEEGTAFRQTTLQENAVRNIADYSGQQVGLLVAAQRQIHEQEINQVVDPNSTSGDTHLPLEGALAAGIGTESARKRNRRIGALQTALFQSQSEFVQSSTVNAADDTAEQLGEGESVTLFCYLGDVIEGALELIAQNNNYTPTTPEALDDDSAQSSYAIPFFSEIGQQGLGPAAQRVIKRYGNFLCSDVIYQSPLTSLEATGDIRGINLADIPISFEVLRSWWFDKVIAPMRTSFYLRHFIESIVVDLIAPALGTNCIDYDEEPTPKITLSTFSMSGEWDTLVNATTQESARIGGDSVSRAADIERDEQTGGDTGTGANLLLDEQDRQDDEEEIIHNITTYAESIAAQTEGINSDSVLLTGEPLPEPLGEIVAAPSSESEPIYSLEALYDEPVYSTLSSQASQLASGRLSTEEFIAALPETVGSTRIELTISDLLSLSNGLSVESGNPQTFEVTIIHQLEAADDVNARSGNVFQDEEDNIYHLIFGETSTGIVKSLSFMREDLPGLREARLFQDQGNNTFHILREVYNSKIRMYGNIAYKPGSLLYIDPKPLDLGYTTDEGSYAKDLGLGGYHYIIRVSNIMKLAEGVNWETTLETKWNNFNESDARILSGQEPSAVCISLKEKIQHFETLRINAVLQGDTDIATQYTNKINIIQHFTSIDPGAVFVKYEDDPDHGVVYSADGDILWEGSARETL